MLSCLALGLAYQIQSKPVPSMNDMFEYMHLAIRKERGYEDEVQVFVDGKRSVKLTRSIDGDKCRIQVWQDETITHEAGWDNRMHFIIDFKGRAYWNYPSKNEGFAAPFKPVEFSTEDDAKGKFQMQRSYDIWIEPSPNPRVLNVKETTLNDKPARLATILFGSTSEGTQEAKMYFELDKWILLRAELKVPGLMGIENIVVECKPKRGIQFKPGTFTLDPIKVTGFAKKAEGDSG